MITKQSNPKHDTNTFLLQPQPFRLFFMPTFSQVTHIGDFRLARFSNKIGTAIISFDLASTASWPKQIPNSVDQVLTVWMASAVSLREPHCVFPSTAITSESAVVTNVCCTQ